jgi:hypothetical protein
VDPVTPRGGVDLPADGFGELDGGALDRLGGVGGEGEHGPVVVGVGVHVEQGSAARRREPVDDVTASPF